MTNEEARAEIDRLLAEEPGRMKIITAVSADNDLPPQHPHAWVAHDVVASEDDPKGDGRIAVVSAEGDWCRGFPEAVLKRVLEYDAAGD